MQNLTIIGERINPGFASSKFLLDNRDLKGIQQLAVAQVEKGARYLTLNIGDRAESESQFLVDVICAIQDVVAVPISFDYPSRAVQELCLKTYDPKKVRGQKPIVNSISELRWDMLEVTKLQPTKIVLMASERLENGHAIANETAEDIANTAARMFGNVLQECPGLTLDDLFVDVSICPIASDTNGQIRRALDAIRLLGADKNLQGIHMVVGLSNIGIMLPKLALDGSRLSVKLESAFLTLAMPLGLDTILGTAGREYEFLPESDFVFEGFKEAIALDGFEAVMRIQQLYRKD
ncbi:MAG: dihydropteroate synthase [Limisphaerales bacterium]